MESVPMIKLIVDNRDACKALAAYGYMPTSLIDYKFYFNIHASDISYIIDLLIEKNLRFKVSSEDGGFEPI